jgi:esterase/lipase
MWSTVSVAADEWLRPTYDEACTRFDESLCHDSEAVDPRSRARLLTPGHRTERAIVFFHGLTNSPQQFLSLAERFTARGYSVLIPRLPYHGYTDRMTTDLRNLRARDLVATTVWAVDLAAGLADEVTVSGISLGGVLAAWAAQYRPVALAAPIAPAMGVRFLPHALSGAAFAALERLPDREVWWDPRHKADLPGPVYAYPRYSTHALAQTERLAAQVLDCARRSRPQATTIWMISNAADLAVSNAASALLVQRWQEAGATNIHAFEFPRWLRLFHDLIDPLQPHAHPDLVHPVLEQIIVDGATPDPMTLRR